MAWRKWLGRSLVLGLLAGMAAAYALVRNWTCPEAVRAQVLEQLREQFPGADATVESASLRLLGGVSLTGLRLSRRDDPGRAPFLEAPVAVLWHDKEQLARRHRLVLRKIELQKPQIRLDRGPDGRWNFENLAHPGRPDQPLPIVVVRGGSVRVTDRLGGDRPPVELRDLHLDLLCDPPGVAQVRGQAVCSLLGTVRAAGAWNRSDSSWGLTLDLPALAVGPAVVQALARFSPEAAAHAAGLAGTAELHAELSRAADPAAGIRHTVRAHLRQGSLRHPMLPAALGDLDVTARCDGSRVTVERLTARLDGPVGGPARVELSAELPAARPPSAQEFVEHWEGFVRRLHLRLDGLAMSRELLARLPACLRDQARPYAPAGALDMELWLDPAGAGWVRRCLLEPRGLSALYELFPYPVEDVRGRIEQTLTSAGGKEVRVNLTARASGRPATITGRVDGPGLTAGVRFDLAADNLPLDERAFAAVPERYQALARSFHATGRVDFRAQIEQTRGQRGYRNRFLLTFHDAAIRYDVFPYPLEELSGQLDIATVPEPDALTGGIARAGAPGEPPSGGWCVFRNFRGRHRGAEATIDGWNQPAPGGGSVLTLNISGRRLPLDVELADALDAVDLRGPWETLSPSGRMDFQARVTRREPSAAPGRPADMTVAIDFLGGAAVRPSFFPYPLTDVAGHFLYQNDHVRLSGFEARHGPARLALRDGDIRLRPEGGFWAALNDATVDPLALDADLAAALPPPMRKAWEAVELRGPLRLAVRRFVADVPPDPAEPSLGGRRTGRLVARQPRESPEPAPPPWLYWDATLGFDDAALSTGLDWEHVFGQLACEGHHRNGQLALTSRLQLRQAFLFHQPVEDLGANLVIDPLRPEVLEVRDLTGRLFGGEVGGEALVGVGDTVSYEVGLNVAQVRLAEAARYNRLGSEGQLSGLANARVHLVGRGGGVAGLSGSGDVDVPEGRLHKLPLLVNLLKLLKLSVPDDTAFEEAHASFQVRGPRLTLNRLDLFGEAISLSGQGSVNLTDGSDLRLDLYALWSQYVRALPGPVRELTADLSKLLFQYEVRGRIGGDDLHARPVPIPTLIDPLHDLVEKVRRRRRNTDPSPPAPRPGFRGEGRNPFPLAPASGERGRG
jgi:hypothetical protein